ncbi:uncharacterized protein LOC110859693 [Folsomia candida]|uniref:uncharacterized protein LOC110859693 n=1 Tax=Folsomia candida TaxID=158441 RepID=UPI000B8EED7F|nr:uncharacterized protein LOC110859693 [Folsomia candida]
MRSKNLLIFSIIFSCFSQILANSEETEDDDWFSFSSSSEEQDLDKNNSTVKKSAPIKEKRWNRAGLCDHDVITSVILKLILDAQDKMAKGDNSTGLMPLDPIYIPEIVMDPEKMRRDVDGGGEGDGNSPIQGTITDVYIKGLSKFNVTGINADLQKMFVNISIALESISISGTGRLKIGPVYFPIFGKGKFLFKPEGVDTSILVEFGTHENGTRYLKDFDYGLALKKLYVELTPPFRPVRGWNPLAGVLSGVGARLFNTLEQRLHPRLRSRGSQEVSKRMGTWKMLNEEVIENMINHSVFCYFG